MDMPTSSTTLLAETPLEGRVAIVTGSTSGIGLGIARAFAAAGADVVINGIADQRVIDELCSECAGLGKRAVYDGANLMDADACKSLVNNAIGRFGRLDILVNNAATNPYYGATLDVPPSMFDKTFEVNLRGPLYWSHAAFQQAFASEPGVIINIASVGGLRTEFGLGVYNLSKAALIHLTRQLANELGRTRVVGIAPGLVKTDFAKVLVDNFGESLERALPTRRLGEPEDIANLAVFLASDKASWITGETYVIDGGAGVRGSGGTIAS